MYFFFLFYFSSSNRTFFFNFVDSVSINVRIIVLVFFFFCCFHWCLTDLSESWLLLLLLPLYFQEIVVVFNFMQIRMALFLLILYVFLRNVHGCNLIRRFNSVLSLSRSCCCCCFLTVKQLIVLLRFFVVFCCCCFRSTE